MKKLSCIMVVLVFAGCLQLIPKLAEAHTPISLPFWEVFDGFSKQNEGPLVEGAAVTGMIAGTIAGAVPGLPLALIGLVAGTPFGKPECGVIGVMPVMIGAFAGQLLVGTAVIIPKKILWDVPKILITGSDLNSNCSAKNFRFYSHPEPKVLIEKKLEDMYPPPPFPPVKFGRAEPIQPVYPAPEQRKRQFP